jgi:hypothetical protein
LDLFSAIVFNFIRPSATRQRAENNAANPPFGRAQNYCPGISVTTHGKWFLS